MSEGRKIEPSRRTLERWEHGKKGLHQEHTGLRGRRGPYFRRPGAWWGREACGLDRLGLVQDVCGSPTFEAPGPATKGLAFFILMEAAHDDLMTP